MSDAQPAGQSDAVGGRSGLVAHTPGPWTANLDSDHGDFVVWGPGDDNFLANIGSAPGEDRVVAFDVAAANACLIAAAPDLLEAAQAAQCACSVLERDSGHLVGCWMPALSEAIAKAEGR